MYKNDMYPVFNVLFLLGSVIYMYECTYFLFDYLSALKFNPRLMETVSLKENQVSDVLPRCRYSRDTMFPIIRDLRPIYRSHGRPRRKDQSI